MKLECFEITEAMDHEPGSGAERYHYSADIEYTHENGFSLRVVNMDLSPFGNKVPEFANLVKFAKG